ncbi:bifunctional glutamate N-acetyltransferase/amino-acid acetyltransferase ArgJ [Glaciimonas immobilis]|uniref:Arginine biosynthesis bifunctional protein ArgJ n=1 Tax=Glaciimonas immobilis TaxID=728004 RepID=A0A840S178_9BURK|nr:bifunctional glutamate N-acetyltransferase/amino-acid acetyltransferase ArgJ [Glaciimonas immobilis]KAF3996231.1 bifunctional glutamate N-acetyltransferase/amino-acid acetyltransferase ArgJ [Glaciimonas immobilis]MBB5202614.1 glutamate N-acetyltransferase/amino-acid N-acetyltransferase [Glaciimonas immobilis]
MSQLTYPKGYKCIVANLGIKDTHDDFIAIISDVPAAVSAVYTRSRFAGASVELSRAVKQYARGVLVIARNANVATGSMGLANAQEVREGIAKAVDVASNELIIASTGVIGRQYPMDNIRAFLADVPPLETADFECCAAAIMTTDTKSKIVSHKVGKATVLGIAKGVGMIEPNMATLLAFFFTDALISPEELDTIFRRVVDKTFNALSIDTDTSTSDSAAIFANGLAGKVDLKVFEDALYEVALSLVHKIATDGEGASKLLEVKVSGARNVAQAKRVAKVIINSPLVKTAVHGADPNWGRVAMAIGKCEEDLDITPERTRIFFGEIEAYPQQAGEEQLQQLRTYLTGNEIAISIHLNIGSGAFTAYGCDLSERYIKINADYTT